MRFNRQFIKSVIPDALFLGPEVPATISCSIDSRTLQPGDIFIAMKGSVVDGHNFVAAALKKSASGLFINADHQDCLNNLEPKALSSCSIIIVPDTLSALTQLATAWRNQFAIPIVGITGSIGKTTTKEMLAAMARRAGKSCLVSSGNQNTVIGCAINILKMSSKHEMAIFEMGISKRGEMAVMAAMVRPTTAIITTIGHSHMEGLGSLQDIACEKRDIFSKFLPENIGIINGDVSVLSTIAYSHMVMRFGCKTTNQIQARKVQTTDSEISYILKIYKDRYHITIPTNHMGPLMNGLAATAAAYVLGFPHTCIVESLKSEVTVSGRFEKLSLKNSGGTIINDCYNASPESMKAALLAFEKLELKGKGHKVAVLGDMLELGVNSPFWHRQLGRFLRKVPSVQKVVLVGEHVKSAQKTMPAFVHYEMVSTWQEAVDYLQAQLEPESLVLVKGSNGVGLQNLVRTMTES